MTLIMTRKPKIFSNENNDQVGEGSDGSSKLNVNLVSHSEQVALRAKNELLREGRKRGFSGFTPEDAAEIEKLKNRGVLWHHGLCNKAAGVCIYIYIFFFFSSVFLSSHSNSLVGGQMYIIFAQENVNTEENVLSMSFCNGSEDTHS